MEQELRVRVLGGTELTLDARQPVELASAKATALLVYLAVTGAGHSRSALAGLLWSDLPEQAARANLRMILTKLRRALPEQLEVTREKVALAPTRPVWVDALEVARLAGAGGDDDELLEAVRLCRGEFLQGWEVPGAPLFEEWVLARRATSRTAMLALMDRAIQRARDRADPATGIDVARRLLELEPLHEEAHRALMWFLATGGQRGAALAQFETCRYVLREEVGVEPSPATLALRDEVALAGEFAGLDQPRAGGGRPAAEPDGELPRPLGALLGRGPELARLHELLDDPACRLVTLVGPGGIGKTRLAVEVAATRRGRHHDGGVFVSFVGTVPARPEEAADLMIAKLAGALGVSLAVPRDPLELLADHLAGSQLLLVLDNLEQLRDAAEVLAEVLRRGPGVQVLATSRRRLGLGAEWLVEVPGLPYPPEGDADPHRYEAVQLFQERARLVRPGFWEGADRQEVARVCRLLAGVPLAVELAAHWVRSATPAAIADRLAGGLDLLSTSAPDVERRHQSLRSVIDWSWQLLTEDERRVLARLSVQRGGFDLEAAAAVAGASLPLLAALVDHSLVEVGEGGRYGMHELLRQYAAERLADDPADERATRARHAAHYAALLPDPGERPAGGGLDLDAEVENLRAATDWLVAHADPARLDAHLGRLCPLYRRKGWFREARAVLTAALAREPLPVLERARWHRLLGEACIQLGEMGPAREHLERTLSLLDSPVPASTPGWLEVLASQWLQRRLRHLGPGASVERQEDRRARAQERAAVCWQLDETYYMLEEPLPMVPIALWGLNQAERSGRLDLVARSQAGLGMTVGTAGLHRLAGRHVRAAVIAAERTDDPMTVLWTQVTGSLHWLAVGHWAPVDAGLGRALAAGADAGLQRLADQALLLGGIARYLTGRFDEAAAMGADARAAGRERRDPMVHLWGLLVQTESRLRLDPADPAIAGWLEEARPLQAAGVSRIDVVRARAAEARFHLAAGRPADAWRATRAAADLAGGQSSFAVYTLEAHAGIPEVGLALAEQGVPGLAMDELRATIATGLRRLRRYARIVPVARPRALTCLGWSRWLDGRHGAARRAWARAIREAERLAMPYELARAHYELGRHLAVGDRAGHLERARSIFETLGCQADLAAIGRVERDTGVENTAR